MASHIRRRLVIAVAATGALIAAGPAGAASGPGAFTTRGAWRFISAPRLHPPKLLTVGRAAAGKLARGDFLLDSFPNLAVAGPMTGQGGPLIVNQKLQPVWLAPIGAKTVSADLQQETYRGRPVLVWWQGQTTRTGATLRGEVVVVDEHYRRVATLHAQRPWVVSLHDAVISRGTIWVTVYRSVHHQNLIPYGGGRNGTVYDAGVQEYDLRTGKLLFTWDALDPGHTANVPLAASEQPASAATAPGAAWDAYHLNSIQVVTPSRILVSMRNTWAAYLIDTTTGKVLWTLGGKPRYDSFSFGRGARFAWQHDVRFVSPNQLALFDDSCCRVTRAGRLATPQGASRGLVLRLDLAHHRASLVKAFPHRPNFDVAFLGSMQRLPGGRALVGWGSLPFFSEYSRTGRQLLDVRFPGKDQSYRALFTARWVGTPAYPPRGAARRRASRTTVYASWNGATQVRRWQVLAGMAPGRLRPVASRGKTGFETSINLGRAGYTVFKVKALGPRGKVLGTSRAFR